jgi:hypothetical protein
LASWDQVIPDVSLRFDVLAAFDGDAVLDTETGLVWEKAPSTSTLAWNEARMHCRRREIGGPDNAHRRRGFRLPTGEELASLVFIHESGLPPGHPYRTLGLPPGHPFLVLTRPGETVATFWAATAYDSARAEVQFMSVTAQPPLDFMDKATRNRAWCVRGAQGNVGPY